MFKKITPLLALILIALFLFVNPGPIKASTTVSNMEVADNQIILKFPFAPGPTWKIIEGYNGPTHLIPLPYQKYSLDFALDDGKTEGKPILAPENGKVAWKDPVKGMICIDLGNNYFITVGHMDSVSSFQQGDPITKGQVLGSVAPPDSQKNNNIAHIHITLYYATDASAGPDKRTAIPFSGDFVIDGHDFKPDDSIKNQFANQIHGLSSTNAIFVAPSSQSQQNNGISISEENFQIIIPWFWKFAVKSSEPFKLLLDNKVILDSSNGNATGYLFVLSGVHKLNLLIENNGRGYIAYAKYPSEPIFIINSIGSVEPSTNVKEVFKKIVQQVQDTSTSKTQSANIAASQESQKEIQASVGSSEIANKNTPQIPAPSKPNLTSPYNWYQSLGEPPTLQWQGDSNSVSYYVVVNSSNTGNVESGWINSTSWKPNLPSENYVYTWKVKAKNSQGLEGSWSDESHFSTASTTLKFEGDISFNPPSPSSANQIKIFASTTGWGGVGVTLRVSVNTSPDGSSSGEWKILKELGVPKFTENDAPIWDTSGWSNGTYKIRVEAKGPNDPNWQNTAIIETTYTLINKTTTSSETTSSETTSSETTNDTSETTTETTTETTNPPQAPPIEDLSFNPGSGAQIGTTVSIHAKATWNSSFRAMRLKIDGNIVYELGAPEFSFSWNTSGCSAGNHSIRLEVAAIGDNDWNSPSSRDAAYNLANVPTPTTTNPPTAPPIEDLSFNPGSGAQIGTTVSIHAKATWNSSFRAMRLKIDGNIVYELGAPEFSFSWNTSGCSAGNHSIRLEVAAIGDNDWNSPSSRDAAYNLTSVQTTTGLSKPSLSSPSNGALLSPGTDVTLQWNSVSGATQYYVEIWGGQYGNSHATPGGGWQNGTSCHIGKMSPGNVLWRVKARDGSGNESPWSDEWNFTPQ